MAATYEDAIIEGEGIEPGKLIWRRYRVPSPGVTEIFLDINPHLRHHLKTSMYLPVGVAVIIPIFPEILAGSAISQATPRLWGTTEPSR